MKHTKRSFLSILMAAALTVSGLGEFMPVTNVQAATGTAGSGNALKAIGINSDAAPQGFDEDDNETNPYGKKTITGDVSDEVFAATMGQSGSAIIGDEVSDVTGMTYTYGNYDTYGPQDGRKGEGQYLLTYRDGSVYDGMGTGEHRTYISDIAVSGSLYAQNAKDVLVNSGYTVCEKDLNEGLDSIQGVTPKHIFLGYKTTTNAREAIADIMLCMNFGGEKLAAPGELSYSGRTYHRVTAMGPGNDKFPEYLGNLNMLQDTSYLGTPIFMYYTKDPVNTSNNFRVLEVSVDGSSSVQGLVTAGGINVPSKVYDETLVGAVIDNVNLNEGAGGAYVYLHMKQEKVADNVADVEGTVSSEANSAPLRDKFMNKTAGGNFDGNTEGKKSQFAMVSFDDENGKLYLSAVDAKDQAESTKKELGFKCSTEVEAYKTKAGIGEKEANRIQALSYMNVVTGDFDGNGRDEIAVYNPDSNAGARVEVYGLKLPYASHDYRDMDSWEIKRTIAAKGEHFVTMDAGDLDQDGLDDLVIGCDDEVTIYSGARRSMLTGSYEVDLTCGGDIEDRVYDPSVVIFKEKEGGKAKTYLGVMARISSEMPNMSSAYQYVYRFNPTSQAFDVVAKKDFYELAGLSRNTEPLTLAASGLWLGEFYTYNDPEDHSSGGTTVLHMPLELHYMNHCFLTPYVISGLAGTAGISFQSGTLGLVRDTYQPRSVYSCGEGCHDGIICYDFQVADLNGDGVQTAFYKVLAGGKVTDFPANPYLGQLAYKHNLVAGHYMGAYSCGKYKDNALYKGSFMPFDMVYEPDNPAVFAVLNTDDDTKYMTYTGKHSFSYSDPEVLAVLSSPPYFKDLLENDELTGNYAESTTSYGRSKGSGQGTSDAVTITAGVFEKIEQGIEVFGVEVASIEAEFNQTASFTAGFSEASELNYSVEYGTSSGADAVVFYSIPTEVYEYETAWVDKNTGEKRSYKKALFFPKNPCVSTIELEKYNTIAENYSELPTIDKKILDHELGDPASYPRTSGNYRNVREFNGNWMGVDFTSAGGGMTQSQSIEMSKENGTDYSSGIELGFSGGVGAGGVTIGISGSEGYEAGWSYVSTSGSSYTAEMQNMPKEAEDYGYGLSWKLFTHEGSYVNKNGDTVKFPVVDYLVSDVMTPPSIPESFRQDYAASTKDSVALQWEYSDPSSADCFNIYRLITIDGRTYDTLAGVVDASEGKQNDRGGYSYSFTDDGVNADGTVTAMKPGIEYKYYIEAERSPDAPPYLSMPSEEISAYTHSDAEYPDVTLSGVEDDVLTVYPDMAYDVKACVSNAGSFDQVSYHWEKYDPRKGFSDIRNGRTDTLSIDSTTADAAGRYRCRVDAMFFNDKLGKLSNVTAYSDVFTVEFKMRRAAVVSLKASSSEGRPVAEVVLKPGSNDCYLTPGGSVRFILEGEDYKKVYTAALASAGSRRAAAAIPYDADVLPDGNYSLTVSYEGDGVFGSLTEDGGCIVVGDQNIYPVLTDASGKKTNTFAYGDVMHVDLYRYSSDGNGNTTAEKLTDESHPGGYTEKLLKTPKEYKDQKITAQLSGVGSRTYTYSYTVKKRPLEIRVPETTLQVGDVEGKLPVPELTEGYTLADDSKTLDDIVELRYKNGTKTAYVSALDNNTPVGTYYAVLEDKNNECYEAQLHDAMVIIGPKTYGVHVMSQKCGDAKAGSVSLSMPEQLSGVTDGTYSYEEGTRVKLTAVPDTGYSFDHWEIREGEDELTLNTATVTRTLLPLEYSFKAVFVPRSVKVTVDDSLYEGGRVVLPEGFVSGGSYQVGTEFTFVAEASGDLVSVQWIKSVGNRSYTVNGDTIVLTVPGEDVTLYPIFKDKNDSGQTDPRVKEPTAKKDLKYNGREKVLIDRGSVMGGTMYYALTLSGSPEPGEDAYSSTVIPAATDAGSYDVWYKVIGDPDHNNVAPDHLTVEIAKAEYDGIVSVHKTVTPGEETDGVIVLPSLPEGASYASAGTISQNCALVTAFTVSGNDLIYSTSAQAKGESAVISIGVSGAKNYEDYAVEVTLTTEGEDWPEPQIIEPEAYTSLKADGSEKQLLKEGRVLGGTLYYVLGNDSETPPGDGWSKNVPVAGKAGTYYVWYMVLGNTGYKDTEPKCIAVVISEGDNGKQGGSGNEEGGGKQTDPENSLKPGESEVTEGDVITEPKAVSSLAPATVRVDGKETAFTLSQNYVDAVTYRGRTIDPEKDLNMRVDKTPIVSQVTLLSGSSISADDLVTVGYVQKNAKNANSKSAKKSTVYAKFKVSKAAKKALSSEDLKKLKKLVKAANKALKKTKCTYTINPLSVTSCRLSVSAKLTEDGKLKVKNGKLKGIKKVYAAIDGAVVPVKLTRKEYEILSPDENAKTVFLKGKKNYTGTAFVTVE